MILPSVLPGDAAACDNATATGGTACFNFPALFISSAAEIAGAGIGFVGVDRASRRRLGGWSYAICALFTVLLAAGGSTAVRVLLVVVARASIFVGSSLTWVVTPELCASRPPSGAPLSPPTPTAAGALQTRRACALRGTALPTAWPE